MFRRSMLMVGCCCAAIVPLLGLTAARGEDINKKETPAAASANGKYEGLLKVISVPEDKATYGEVFDYGEYPACDYADYTDLPRAYWVYVAPKWYLWKGLAAKKVEIKVPPAASVNGKYEKLLVRLHLPDDEATYGKEYDWGHWNGTSWKTFDNLPPGYWVYVAPHWYIWKTKVKPDGS